MFTYSCLFLLQQVSYIQKGAFLARGFTHKTYESFTPGVVVLPRKLFQFLLHLPYRIAGKCGGVFNLVDFSKTRQTAKLKTPPNFPAIRYAIVCMHYNLSGLAMLMI